MKNFFFDKRVRTSPTIGGWLCLCAAAAAAACLVTVNCNSFLSVSKPVDADVMVVEGWLPVYALARAADEYRKNHYSLLVSTGIKIDRGDPFWQERTYADMGASSLRHLGLDSVSVVAVPASEVRVDRTYASACALKRWIDSTRRNITKVNLVSLGPHSRRSRLLFQKALGKGVEIGVISCPDETYDPHQWWITSNGFKSTIDEAVSYCYTKLVFSVKRHGKFQ